MAEVRVLTGEQVGQVTSDLESLGESIVHVHDTLFLTSKPDPSLVLNELHEMQERLNRLVSQMEDISNG